MTPDYSCAGFADVPAHFHRDAPLDPHQQRRHEAVLSLLRTLPPGRLLDYGFGWGDIAWQAARTHPDIRAVDVEQRRVDFARIQYPSLDFELCRPDGLDYPDDGFDVVLSIVVLPFVPDDDAYMAEIRRVLRPGGHLILATKTSRYLPRLWARATGQRDRGRRDASLRHHDAAAATRLLERHGFQVLSRRAFYDPPFEARKNLADVLNGACEVAGSALGIVDVAPYPLFLARLSN